MWEPVSSEDLGQRDLECWVSEAGANSQLREKGNILSNVLDSGRKQTVQVVSVWGRHLWAPVGSQIVGEGGVIDRQGPEKGEVEL